MWLYVSVLVYDSGFISSGLSASVCSIRLTDRSVNRQRNPMQRKLMGLKLKDTLDIQAVEVGRRDVWFGRALLPYAIERATRGDILLPRAPVW